jgi:hypothetical protein
MAAIVPEKSDPMIAPGLANHPRLFQSAGFWTVSWIFDAASGLRKAYQGCVVNLEEHLVGLWFGNGHILHGCRGRLGSAACAAVRLTSVALT